jgi:hypothetical protein
VPASEDDLEVRYCKQLGVAFREPPRARQPLAIYFNLDMTPPLHAFFAVA